MKQRWIVALKVAAHAACFSPVAWLLWQLYLSATTNPEALGPDPTHTVTFFTGRGTLRLLVITLAITPIRRLIPQLSWLVRFRRLLGLYAFFYACLHLMTYVWLYAGFSWAAMVDDISRRRFITAGLTAWLMLLPLALTSTAWSIRKLGGKNWNRLHWLTYAAAITGVVHYWWGVKTGVKTPMTITIVLAVLLLARPILARRTASRKGTPARVAAG
ncbi:MAG TPA: protein-methionine-sulfoxide reductase heme-binding subunit MsrQ [Acidobacteriaceae bacterium]|jgi:sulfoxide reductase heme-binding subunit YedZ|nr:protein-methionine-sulfoxide reductase heme-binding subunit MsrQ [Acidobacteriaceae bacterium]